MEAATANDAVAWGYTLEKLQDRSNHVPDRASPSCSKGASAVLASLHKAAIFVLSRQLSRGRTLQSGVSRGVQRSFRRRLCVRSHRDVGMHRRQQALGEGPAVAGGLKEASLAEWVRQACEPPDAESHLA